MHNERWRISRTRPTATAASRRTAVDLSSLVRMQAWRLGLGVALVIVNRASFLVLPFATQIAIDQIIGQKRADLLSYVVVGVLVAGLVQGVSTVLITQIFSKGTYRLIAQLRRDVYAHVLRLPIAFYDATKSGILLTRIMNDVEGVRYLVGTGLLAIVSAAVTTLGGVVLLFRISGLLTFVTLGILGLHVLITRRASQAVRPITLDGATIMADVQGRLLEALNGARVIKAYNAAQPELQVFTAGLQRVLDNAYRSVRVESWVNFAATTISSIIGATLIWIAVAQIHAGTLTLGGFAAFTALVAMVIGPGIQLGSTLPRLGEAAAACERLSEVLRQEPEDDDPRRVLGLESLQGRIVFEHVSFEYERGIPVLQDVSFTAESGSITALVGPSGAGKSTLIGLVSAFHAPTVGRILLDDRDLGAVRLDAYRARLGVVFQESFLLDGTIAENVAFARPGASRASVLEACRLARVDEFAERFTHGYDTTVGERGVRLSGGQKQRVSIARAILADPAILILDEATSSLDSESEALIQDALQHLMCSRTTFVIAHRLSTIKRADQILVLDAGRIVERGTHDSLYRAGGRYHGLYTRQYGTPGEVVRDASVLTV